MGGGRQLRDTLAALQAVIFEHQDKGLRHEPTPTEYFAVILKSLSSGEMTETLLELLKVLLAVVPNSSKTIIQSQFKPFSQILLAIIKANSEDSQMTEIALDVLGVTLKCQDTTDGFWNSVPALQSVNALLAFIDEERSKIRKTSHDSLTKLVQHHGLFNCAAARQYLSDFCLEVIKNCTRFSYKRALSVVHWLEHSLVYMTEQSVVQLVDYSLKLQSCEIPKLISSVMRMMDSFFQGSVSQQHSFEMLHSLLKRLLQTVPNTLDVESNSFYCTALASGVIAIHRLNRSAAQSSCLKVMEIFAAQMESEFVQVHCAVGTAMKRLFQALLVPATLSGMSAEVEKASKAAAANKKTDVLSEVKAQLKGNDTMKFILRTVSALDPLLQLNYQQSWLYSLDAIRSLLEIFKGQSVGLLLWVFSALISKVADIYQAIEVSIVQVETAIHISLMDTIGAILRVLGVRHFLALVPLVSSAAVPSHAITAGTALNAIGYDDSRSWIITALHHNIKHMHCTLQDFGQNILPIAMQCSQGYKAVQSNDTFTGAQKKMLRNKVIQLWSLFPDFCGTSPRDMVESFNKMSPTLSAILSDDNASYPEISTFVMQGLMHLARGVQEECHGVENPSSPKYEELKKQSVTYFPMFLMRIEQMNISDSGFQAHLQCIAAWIFFAPQKLVTAICNRLLGLVLVPPTNADGSPCSSCSIEMVEWERSASNWIAVLLVIIPRLSPKLIDLLFKSIKPLLSFSQNPSLQKRGYSLLHALLESHSADLVKIENNVSLLEFLSQALVSCHVSSRNMRLRCMELLLAMTEEQEELQLCCSYVLPELLLCLKDSNKKTRDTSHSMMKLFIRKLESKQFLTQLCSGLVGETTLMRAAAITALCMWMLDRRGNEEELSMTLQLLPTVSILLQEEASDQTKAVLSFVRVLVAVIDINTLHEVLPQLIPLFTGDALGVYKHKYSARCRYILRKLLHRVGEEALRPLMPQSDLSLLEYVCKEQRRIQRRKEVTEKQSKLDKMMGSDSDYSSEEDDEDLADDDKKSVVARSVLSQRFHSSKAAEDYRISQKVKAIRAKDALISDLPRTLDDLLDDKITAGAAPSGSKGKPTAQKVPAALPQRRPSKDAMMVSSLLPAIPEDEDEEFKVVVTGEGKVVIQEREKEKVPDKKLKRSSEEAEAGDAQAEAHAKQGEIEERQSKKRKLNLKEPGIEYRSAKGAGGDVWRKGMMEPHAFIPLDARLFSKKNKQQAIEHFGVVVKNGRKEQKRKHGKR